MICFRFSTIHQLMGPRRYTKNSFVSLLIYRLYRFTSSHHSSVSEEAKIWILDQGLSWSTNRAVPIQLIITKLACDKQAFKCWHNTRKPSQPQLLSDLSTKGSRHRDAVALCNLQIISPLSFFAALCLGMLRLGALGSQSLDHHFSPVHQQSLHPHPLLRGPDSTL